MELVEAISRAASAGYLVLAGLTQQGHEANVYAPTRGYEKYVLVAVSRFITLGARGETERAGAVWFITLGARGETNALFVWTYQQNQYPSSSIFLSQQTSEQCFQHNKPVKRTGCKRAGVVWFITLPAMPYVASPNFCFSSCGSPPCKRRQHRRLGGVFDRRFGVLLYWKSPWLPHFDTNQTPAAILVAAIVSSVACGGRNQTAA
jgi:hypothetical protein